MPLRPRNTLCYRCLVMKHSLPPDRSVPSTALVQTPAVPPPTLALRRSAVELAIPERLQQYITSQPDPSGRPHWMWTGPVRPGSGIPLMHRWNGHKNVSAHRILWDELRLDSPLGERSRLRRLDSCAWEMCVHPGCFELASTPLEPQTLPDYDSQPVRMSRSITGTVHRWSKSKVIEGVQETYRFQSESFKDVRCQHCDEINHFPVCPMGHLIDAAWATSGVWDDIVEHLGEPYRCSMCTRISHAARELRGSRPRAGFRPTSPQHNNYEQEMEKLEAALRGGDIPEVVGPGSEDEREMQEMERSLRETPHEPDE